MNPKVQNIWHIWVLSTGSKSESAYSETEGSQDVAELKETEEVAPPSDSNAEDSESKQEILPDENDSGSSGSTFSYDQLKAKSDNPVTGIDFKRREVGPLTTSSTTLKSSLNC